MSGNFKNRHHVEPRVKLNSPREESFPIPLKYIDVSRTTHTNLDVKHESRIDDNWNIDWSRDLYDYYPPRRTQAHTFSRTCTTAHYPHISSVGTPHWLKVKSSLCHTHLHFSFSLDMSFSNVPFSRFPQVSSSPTCLTSQTSAISTWFCGSRNNPCGSV